MKNFAVGLLLTLCFLCFAAFAAAPAPAASRQGWTGAKAADAVIEEAIAGKTIPGAVLVVGHGGQVVYRKAYGDRAVVPSRQPMTLGTIFDCASLTKVVVTAPAVMRLVEQGKLRLSDPITKHLPRFGGRKSRVTVLDLLTHFSGLRPDLDISPTWSGYETGIERAYREVPVAKRGSRFLYSDINYILLAEMIRKVTGQQLADYAAENIFEPLGMRDSMFRPAKLVHSRIAPTGRLPSGEMLLGVVHDPTTRYMGGVSGHAGLFSTAADLSRFAQMMLRGGRTGDHRVLSPLSVVKMTTAQSPPGNPVVRGLGWDLNSPYSSPRGDLFPMGSYGHTGFTGASMWIDPVTESYVILMTSRLHPKPSGSVVSLRSHLASIAAAAIEQIPDQWARRKAFLAAGRGSDAAPKRKFRPGAVLSGLDVLVRDDFKPLAGKRVGLITNHTGIDRARRRNVDLFAAAPAVKLQAIFSPEHGIAGRLDHSGIGDTVDEATGVPVYSLYQGKRRRPSAEMLEGLDALVFDIQDIGARFYTYTTTMAYAMEEAAKHGIPFYVFDRPNPITGEAVEGPLLDDGYRSFIGYFPMPVRHGMTVGELAGMFNQERKLGADLRVVKMEGWDRGTWFDETGLPWVNPSPNIRTLDQAILYPGIALLEGLGNYSVGRGTGTPFQFIGADWIDGTRLADYLSRQVIDGARFYAVERRPKASRFAGSMIQGVQITIVNRDILRPSRLGLEIAAALLQLYPGKIQLDQTARLVGSQATLDQLEAAVATERIWAMWDDGNRKFLRLRQRYLLY